MEKSSVLAPWAIAVMATIVSACANLGGSKLERGVSSLPEVVASMGEPAMRWKDPDGRQQLAYPKGPLGTETFMVFIDAKGRLEQVEGVLNMEHFARIDGGKSTKADVLRVLGPPMESGTIYFKARDELVWEWRFCDSWNQQAFFDVLFDGTTGVVRTTYQRPAYDGEFGPPGCGRWVLPVR